MIHGSVRIKHVRARVSLVSGTLACIGLGLSSAGTWADVKPGNPELGVAPIPTYGSQSAGFSVDLSRNVMKFNVVDLVVEGNSKKLPIVVSRSESLLKFNPSLRVPAELANWSLDVPRISSWRGTLRSDGQSVAFNAPTSVWSNGYCHNPVYVQGTGQATSDLHWWAGLQLEIPLRGSRELIFAKQDSAGGQVVYPQINVITGIKGNVEYVTTDNWKAECIDLPQGNRSGFEVSAPDGTKYTFDVFASPKSIVNEAMNWTDTLAAYVYASRVEDPFGNFVEYFYESDNNGGQYVSEIKASDGRWLKFYYDVVDYSSHSFWRPKYTVKRLSKVEHLSDDGAQVLAEVEYFYYVSETQNFADHGTLAVVMTPDGRFWDYSYQDHTRATSVHDPRYPPPPGYWGTNCDYAVGFTNWYCGPTFSTLPAKLTGVTTPAGAHYQFDYIESSGASGWPSARGTGPNYVWYIDQIGTDTDDDGTLDWTSFALTMGANQESYTNEVEYPYERRDVYTFERSTYAPGSETTKAYLKTLLGGSLTKHEVFDLRSGSPALLQSKEFEWLARRDVGDHARTCWIGECDKADIWSRVVLTSTTEVNGFSFSATKSNFTDFDQPQTIVTAGPNVSISNNYTYKNDELAWIIGLEESHEVVGEGITSRTYGALGELQFVSEYGNETYYEYDALGNIEKIKWPRNAGSPHEEETYQNYHRGVAQNVTLANDDTLSFSVNEDGTIASSTNARGFTTSTTYDPFRRPTQITPPVSQSSSIDWWDTNPWERVELTGNREQVTRRDRYDRTVWDRTRDLATSNSTSYIEFEYDTAGRMTFESRHSYNLGSSKGLAYEYDALGRLVKVSDTASGHETNYCYGTACNAARPGLIPVQNGYVSENPDGFETIYEFEYFGGQELVSKIHAQISKQPVEWASTEISRNKLGKILDITQGGITRQYRYTPRQLLWKFIDPEIGETVFDYDLAGNMISETVGGGMPTILVYDERSRLKSSSNGSDVVALTYDENDNIKTSTQGRNVHSIIYDEEDRVTLEVASVPGYVLETSYDYDNMGNLSSITSPSGWTVSYSPDALGRPTVATGQLGSMSPNTFASNVIYDASGDLSQFTFGNGLIFVRSEDNRDQLDQLIVRDYNFNALSDLAYAYDGRSNIQTIVDNLSPGNSLSYTYDGLSRLRTATGGGADEAFDYDTAGNIEFRSLGGQAITYTYDAQNRLDSMSNGRTFAYDQRGNIAADGARNYTFDSFDNLLSVSGSESESYQYDGLKRRVSRESSGVQTLSAYGKGNSLLHELMRPTGESKDFVYLAGQIIASVPCTMTDEDADFDAIPNCFEVRWGLDPQNASDSSADEDNDGLTNLQEFLLASNPLHTDSDGDQMPDGFESDNGLNPIVDDGHLDLDGDGVSNLGEYLAGTNPND